MKKLRNLLLIMAVVLGIPVNISASTYTSLNLEETLTREKIEHDLSNYKETSDQVTIYMFRGDRCAYCQSFLNFLNSNVKEYGDYFKLISFEVWHNEANAALMKEVAEHFGKTIKGVPFIIIGEKTFQGYTSSYDNEILETITNYYNNKKSYKDIVSTYLVEKEENTTGAAITIIVILAAFAGVGFLIYMAKEDTNSKETKKENEIKITELKEKEAPKGYALSLEKKTKTPVLPKLKENKEAQENKKEETKETVSPKTKATTKELPKKKEEVKKVGTTKTSTKTTAKKTPSKKTSSTKTTKARTAKKSGTAVKKTTSNAASTKKTKKNTTKTNSNAKKNKASTN